MNCYTSCSLGRDHVLRFPEAYSQVRGIEERFGSEVGARLGTTEGQERLKAKDVNRTTNVRRFLGLRGSSLAPVRFLTPETSGRGLKIAMYLLLIFVQGSFLLGLAIW
jgi:hypothetical protein